MQRRWTQGLEGQVKTDILQFYKESSVLRKRLQSMLTDIIDEKRAGSTLESHYDNPNWAFLQAHRHGYERALRDIIELITE